MSEPAAAAAAVVDVSANKDEDLIALVAKLLQSDLALVSEGARNRQQRAEFFAHVATDYKLLTALNEAATSKYASMALVTKSLIVHTEDLRAKYRSFEPYLARVDEICESVAKIEQVTRVCTPHRRRLSRADGLVAGRLHASARGQTQDNGRAVADWQCFAEAVNRRRVRMYSRVLGRDDVDHLLLGQHAYEHAIFRHIDARWRQHGEDKVRLGKRRLGHHLERRKVHCRKKKKKIRNALATQLLATCLDCLEW